MTERLLYFCLSSVGGLAEYAHHQASELAAQSVDVTLLCGIDWPFGKETAYRQRRELPKRHPQRKEARWRSQLRLARYLLVSHFGLVRILHETGIKRVLMCTYLEYLAPVWAPSLRRLNRSGVVFGAIVHDPVRDHIVGPQWWHRHSISEGYSFLRELFVHEAIDLSADHRRNDLRITVIPIAPYEYPAPSKSRQDFRAELTLPPDAVVALSFGHIRDGKNLDLILQAMADVKEVFLIVAGTQGNLGQKPVAYYQQLAETLGISDRCRWLIEYHDPVSVANIFTASDLNLLTYSGAFRSASGVLNIAAQYDTPVLASCGHSALGTAVEQYALGIRVESDSKEAIARGIRQMMETKALPDWAGYRRDHSWKRNARAVITAMDLKL
jgi:glycosyltransferase involved in cell wall biosynthesis